MKLDVVVKRGKRSHEFRVALVELLDGRDVAGNTFSRDYRLDPRDKGIRILKTWENVTGKTAKGSKSKAIDEAYALKKHLEGMGVDDGFWLLHCNYLKRPTSEILMSVAG